MPNLSTTANELIGSNGLAFPIRVVDSALPAPATLLGQTLPRIPVGGRIRAGIKVLTKRAAEHALANQIYEQGVAKGLSFEAIERELSLTLPELKNPLTPKNVPYFTVRGEDFPNPELAGQILQRFGEDRGDGIERLYRLPVVFPADAWQSVMPHELVAWTASERRYWSQYSPDGQQRFCMTHAAVPVDSTGRRTIRIWGGRKTVPRSNNGGLCDPEQCPDYQAKRCNLSGRFIFFIPGIKSISAFELGTNSFYAMQAAIQKFQTIGFMRGGRISGFLDEQGTSFLITKRLVEVARIDEQGQPTRVAQWLIELEAPVDVTALLRPDADGQDDGRGRHQRANQAARVLEGAVRDDRQVNLRDESLEPDTEPVATPTDQTSALNSPRQNSIKLGKASAARQDWDASWFDATLDEPVLPRVKSKMSAKASRQNTPVNDDPSQAAMPSCQALPATDPVADTAAELSALLQEAAALGIDGSRYEHYAQRRWGSGWKLNANGRKRALQEIRQHQGNPQDFADWVSAVLAGG